MGGLVSHAQHQTTKQLTYLFTLAYWHMTQTTRRLRWRVPEGAKEPYGRGREADDPALDDGELEPLLCTVAIAVTRFRPWRRVSCRRSKVLPGRDVPVSGGK